MNHSFSVFFASFARYREPVKYEQPHQSCKCLVSTLAHFIGDSKASTYLSSGSMPGVGGFDIGAVREGKPKDSDRNVNGRSPVS